MKRARASRHHPRGMTLLIALAVISVVTAATLVSLRVVSQESELQGRERHSREAFFAAEAGLAEGREVITKRLDGGKRTLTEVMATRLRKANEPNLPNGGTGWYEVIPSSAYTLKQGAGQAVDPTVNTKSRELRDNASKPFLSFPEQNNVSYRVFLHDDDDVNNNAVWLVSMGEVQGADSTVVMARSVVRALVFAESVAPLAGGYKGQKLGNSSKTASTPVVATPVDLSKSKSI